jgi:FtsZ-interacting cell division protein ZipA
MIVAEINNADAVAWISLIVGILVLLAGVVIGLYTSLAKTPADAGTKMNEAKDKLDETKSKVNKAKTEIQSLGSKGLEAGGAPDTRGASAATDEAAASAEAAKSAIQQIESAIASLPENLRFAGLLVLVGAVLISVATIQFGGTSLF